MVQLRCPVTINHIHQKKSCTYMIPYKQLSLADFFTDCQNKFDNDKYEFLSMLEETIDLDEIVPVSFVSHFHAATGRPRKHLLYPMLRVLLLQLIFSIPTTSTSLLIVFLKYSQELRDFCGFDVVPDASKFTRFKQDFLLDLQSMFDHLVDLTEPICQRIDKHKASMLLFDTSGIEAWVTENNPLLNLRFSYQYKTRCKLKVSALYEIGIYQYTDYAYIMKNYCNTSINKHNLFSSQLLY